MHPETIIEYSVIDAEQIDLIRPLWEKLNAHHSRMSSYFSEEISARRFDDRKQQLLADDKRLHLLLAFVAGAKEPSAYCIASLSPAGEGEIDSVFVDDPHRGSGIGTELMRRALSWLDACGAKTKTVNVLFENDSALRFYSCFGFHPRTANLFQKKINQPE